MYRTTLLRRVLGVIFLIVIGIIHLFIIGAGFHLQEYLGVLFILDTIISFVGALWIAFSDASFGWLLGTLAAVGSLVGYLVTRTLSLPGLHILPWNAPFGLPALIAEALFTVLALFALARRSSTRMTKA